MPSFFNVYSQTRDVQERRAKRLHPVNELNRFAILVCCFFCSICVSLTFAFEIMSSRFKSQFDLSTGDLSTISTVGLVFCYFLIPYSLIYENVGPCVPFLLCGATGLVGALGLGLTFEGKMKGNLATITVFYALLNTASGLFDTTYISTLFEIFPRNRGLIIGLSKVMTGLGTSILSCICNTVFEGNLAGFVYFLAALISVVSIISALVIVLPPYCMNWWRRRGKTTEQIAALRSLKPYYEKKFVPKRRLICGYAVVITLIVFFAIEAPVVAYTKDVSQGAKLAVGIIAIVLTMCLVIPGLPLRCLGGMDEPAPAGFCEEEIITDTCPAEKTGVVAVAVGVQTSEDGSSLTDDVAMSDAEASVDEKSLDGEDNVASSRQDPRYPAKSVVEYLKQPELWLLIGYIAFSQPMGIIVSYNSSTLSVALTHVARSESLSALYSAFLGVGNSVGRMLFGLFEAYVQHQDPQNRKVLITCGLFVSPVLIAIGGILIQVMPGNSILLPYIIVYVQNGFGAALAALVFTSLFEKFHNTLYNIGFLVTVICVVCFNRALFGVYVDKRTKALGLSSSSECNEASCVRVPLIVVTVLGAASVVFAVALHLRYSRFVRRARAAAAEQRKTADAAPAEVEPASASVVA